MQFIERGRDGWGMPQPGAARKIADEYVEVLVTRTLTEMGPGRPRLHAMHFGFVAGSLVGCALRRSGSCDSPK
jgi:hypothetical protein